MKTVQNLTIEDYSERYLDVLEDLYGDFNLHPDLSIEEVCEEWNSLFAVGKAMEAEPQPSVIINWQEPYIDVLESLYGPMFVQPDLTIEEVNLEWMNLFMSGTASPATYRKVA